MSKGNADNAVEEQNWRKVIQDKKVKEIINEQIDLLSEASKHVSWEKLPIVSLAIETLLKDHRFDLRYFILK